MRPYIPPIALLSCLRIESRPARETPLDWKIMEVAGSHCLGDIALQGRRRGTKPDLNAFRYDFARGPGQPVEVLKKLIHYIRTDESLLDYNLGLALCLLANLITVESYDLLAAYYAAPVLVLLNQAFKRQMRAGDRVGYNNDAWVWLNGARNLE